MRYRVANLGQPGDWESIISQEPTFSIDPMERWSEKYTDGYMPYNGIQFSILVDWSLRCLPNQETAKTLSEKLKNEYFGSKEVPTNEQRKLDLNDEEHEILSAAKACVSNNCIKLMTIDSWLDGTNARAAEDKVAAEGRKVIRIPTGKIVQERGETHVQEIWSCPIAPGTQDEASTPGVSQGILLDKTKTSFVPAVATVGVVAVVLALLR